MNDRSAARARAQRVVALHHQGLDTAEIAGRTKLSKRSVRRILVRLGVSEPQPTGHLAPELVNRILLYAAEGMPANWIAEDLPVRYETALRHAGRDPRHAESVREWQLVWQQIRTDPVLLELHYEIAPLWSEIRLRALDAA